MRQIYLGNTLINDTFLGSDRMSDVLQEATLQIDWLIIGGGASGGGTNNRNAGGGGAGRFVSASAQLISAGTSINIVIGSGGASIAANVSNRGNDGGASTINILGTTYTATGGGGGGAGSGTTANQTGRNGGSGGGAGNANVATSGGTQIVGTPIAGFGNNGVGSSASDTRGGDGGGAGVSGNQGRLPFTGTAIGVGGVGGGQTSTGSTRPGSGGNGAICCPSTASGAGQNGMAQIRYAGPPQAIGGTITQSGGFTIHTFTSNGTFTY